MRSRRLTMNMGNPDKQTIIGPTLPNIPWEERPDTCRDPAWRSSRNSIIPRDLISSSNSSICAGCLDKQIDPWYSVSKRFDQAFRPSVSTVFNPVGHFRSTSSGEYAYNARCGQTCRRCSKHSILCDQWHAPHLRRDQAARFLSDGRAGISAPCPRARLGQQA